MTKLAGTAANPKVSASAVPGILKRPPLPQRWLNGSEVVASTVAEVAATLKSDYEKYGAIFKAANIKLD